jgi:hypothetical protein
VTSRDVKAAPIIVSPSAIGRLYWNGDRPEMAAGSIEDPNASSPCAIDMTGYIHFHAVR